MQRIVCRGFGGPDLLELVDEPAPEVGPGDVLIEVEAAGVSFVDGLIVSGKYQIRPELPFTPGSVFSGRAARRGADAGAPAVGTAVACIDMDFGCYTSHAVRPAAAVVPVPDGVGMAVAASAAESYSTLIFAVTRRVTIEPGENVAEQAEYRPLGGHAFQGACQADGIKLGQDVVRGLQLFGLGIHEGTIAGLAGKRRGHV